MIHQEHYSIIYDKYDQLFIYDPYFPMKIKLNKVRFVKELDKIYLLNNQLLIFTNHDTYYAVTIIIHFRTRRPQQGPTFLMLVMTGNFSKICIGLFIRI